MDEIDRILAADDPLVPPAGFTARVMTAVREAGAEEPPLPLPWGRFALGLAASVATAVSIASVLSSPGGSAALAEVLAVPGVSEALFAAAVSVALAQALQVRARADF